MDLARLYDAWASRLLAYMMTLTRDRGLAEDALHNLFVRLATQPRTLNHSEVYLLKAARNEALLVLRRRRREQPLADLRLIEARPGSEPPFEAAALSAALDQIPREQAEVVLLHLHGELPFREVGEVVGISPDTAASRYRYAIARLQTILEPWISKKA